MDRANVEVRRARRWFEIEPPAVERLELQTSPRVSTVASYVFTRAAERSWEVLNQHLAEPHGGVFWIRGPAGCGKTHFLDYVIALQRRAGALDAQNARRLVCGLELAGRITGAEVEMFLLSVLAEQIGGDRRSGDLFRQMRGAAALNVALETASRTGIRAVTVAIDFATSDCEASADFFAMLAQVAAGFRQVKFTVIAASRAMAPDATRPLLVAPHDPNEETTIAVRRARRLLEDAELDATRAYAGIDTAGLAPDAIFPFHPTALKALRTIANRPSPDGARADRAAIVSLSRLAREVLASSSGDGEMRACLLYPPDLTINAEISKLLAHLLPEAGRAAWKIARDSIAGLDPYEKDLAREIVDSLMVENVCGATAALPIEELKSLLPIVVRSASENAHPAPAVRDLLRRLEVSTGGVIRLETDAARFDPAAAGAPELAAFNAALMLARGFDPRLTIARDRAGLDARLNRLDSSMALAVEGAVRTRGVLTSALREAKLEMPAADGAAIAQYIALAEGGAAAMLEAAADRSYLAAAAKIASAYEVIAATAESIPRMRAMREYLVATGLRASSDETGAASMAQPGDHLDGDRMRTARGRVGSTGADRTAAESRRARSAVSSIQMDLCPVLPERARNGARRWSTSRWLPRMRSAIATRSAASTRSSRWARPRAQQLAARVAELAARVVRCELASPVAPETTPRCSSCGFILGGADPRRGTRRRDGACFGAGWQSNLRRCRRA